MNTQTNISYNKLKIPELKALCREKELWGYSRKKKTELIDCLNKSDVTRNTFCGTWYLPHSHVHN